MRLTSPFSSSLGVTMMKSRAPCRLVLLLWFGGLLAIPAAAADLSLPTGPLALRDALAAALLGSPDLAVFSWELRAKEAQVLQAGLLPNPALSTEVEDFGGSGDRLAFEQTQITVSLAQLIELGGKRAKRLRLAAFDRDLAAWDYEVARLNVVASVSKAFTATLAAQRRRQLFGELVSLAERSVDAVATQVKAGATSPVEIMRAEAALGRTETQLRQAERDLANARTALAVTWGSPTPGFSEAVGDLTAVASPPPIGTLFDAIQSNPDVARWVTEIEQRTAAVAVEKARAIPSLTVGLGGRQFAENGDKALVAGFSLPLPLFDRNQGNILAADRRLAQAAASRDRATVAVQRALAAAYEDLSAGYAQVVTLRDEVLPKAEGAFAGARDAYQRGLLRFLDMLDAQRTLFETKDQYVQTLAAYHIAAADIERLSGMPLTGADLEEAK